MGTTFLRYTNEVNAKRKGNAGEHKFANWLQSKGIKAYKNSSSGGNQWKSDIHNNIGINFEIKTVKRINLQEAWKQTDHDSSLARSTPMLGIHFDGMPENEWLMVLHSEDWIHLMMGTEMVTPQATPENREKKYALDQARVAIGKALKFLD